MKVKWRGLISESRDLPGGGPQGSVIGNLEYISQTNNNADNVPEEHRWKCVDDLTTMEIVNLLTVGLSSYNFMQHVPSDISTHGQYVDASKLQTQNYINEINNWSDKQKMILNEKKTKSMIVNFT